MLGFLAGERSVDSPHYWVLRLAPRRPSEGSTAGTVQCVVQRGADFGEPNLNPAWELRFQSEDIAQHWREVLRRLMHEHRIKEFT
mmetsp:Transcript_10893/g.18280  ORF Transcript_10893/g.18280 Transcript_10893/m.18280 type:complete len:85 (-) Transcript_10893:3-257(-)